MTKKNNRSVQGTRSIRDPSSTTSSPTKKRTTSNKANTSTTSTKNTTTTTNNSNHFGPNQLSSSAKHSMRVRLISAFVGLIIVVPAIFLGDWIYFGLLTLALGIACWEILGCAKRRTVVIFIIYFVFVAAITYWPIFKTLIVEGTAIGKIDNYFTSIYLSIIVVMIGFFFLFFLTVIYKDFSVLDACFLITMGVMIGFGFQCLYYLRYIPITIFGIQSQPWQFTADNTFRTSLLLLYVIMATFITDAGAYFVGIFFGKNKMNERISPKKTWEGFVGGIVISFIVTTSVGVIFAACRYPIIPLFDLDHWYYILIASLLIPLFATLGDFVFSSIKRYWGIKDYGKIMPGHGGVLDRLDSIFFASIIAAIFVAMLLSLSGGDIDWAKFLV